MLLQIETISFVTALVTLQLAIVLYILGFIAGVRSKGENNGSPAPFTFPVLLVAWLALTISLVVRALQTGHVPFTDLYEITASFCWGVLLGGIVFQWRLKAAVFGAGGATIAYALLIYAFTLPSQHSTLPPILQGTILLPLHVSCAIIAYGMFGMGFVSAIFLLIQEKRSAAFLPSVVMLDRAGYLSVLTGLPFMTLVIVLGSIWANMAWGRFWAWDPKETASLVTWLIYVCYLVTRWFCRWSERRSAAILIAGFVAVLVTFFGNLVFAGLHSYVR